MKEVLVLGGGGFIGRNIVEFLVNRGIAMLLQPILKKVLIGAKFLKMGVGEIVSRLYWLISPTLVLLMT